jgi:hypothetical protein
VTPTAAATTFQVHYTYRRDNKLEPNPQVVQDHGQRLLIIELKQ